MSNNEVTASDINQRILSSQAENIILMCSKQPCSGTTVRNDKKTLKNTKEFFHKTALTYFVVATPIILLSVIAIIIGLIATGRGFSLLLMLPVALPIIAGSLLINIAFKDDTTSKLLGKVLKDFQPDKKYVVIYHTYRTLIHELFHIKKGHLETKGSNLRQDWEIMPDVRRTLRKIRRDVA